MFSVFMLDISYHKLFEHSHCLKTALVCVFLRVNWTFPSLPGRPHGPTRNRGTVVLCFVPLSQLHVAMYGVAGSVNNYRSVNFSCGIINGLLFCHYGKLSGIRKVVN